MNHRGKFIVIEGLEGAGKSSAIQQIESLLLQKNIIARFVREPGGTQIAEEIRSILKKNHDETLQAKTELLLMYSARSQLVTDVIKPALEQGIWVVADRFEWSSIAYQGWGRELGHTSVKFLSEFIVSPLKPDLTIYLDISPEIGLERAARRSSKDRFEQEQLDFFVRVRQGYQHLVDENPNCVVIDAEQPLVDVRNQIFGAIRERLLCCTH